MARKKITPKQRWRIYSRDKFRCTYCGASAKDGARLVLDHAISVNDLGSSNDENLVTACERCNQGKRDQSLAPPDDLLAMINHFRSLLGERGYDTSDTTNAAIWKLAYLTEITGSQDLSLSLILAGDPTKLSIDTILGAAYTLGRIYSNDL